MNHRCKIGTVVIQNGLFKPWQHPPMKAPPVVMLPILLLKEPAGGSVSVNHRLPSGPAVIPSGSCWLPTRPYSVIVPLVVILPIKLLPDSVNHRLPSGPAVIPHGPDNEPPYSVMLAIDHQSSRPCRSRFR